MKIALIGYGKMGKAIEAVAAEQEHTIGLKIHSGNHQELTESNLKDCDVAVEFSTPETAVNNILKCFDAGIPVISGTTGWLQRLGEVNEICLAKNGTFLYASNFSIGVNILFAINQQLAKMMNRFPGYKPSIEEIHHTEKKDSPSGTAITLAEQIIQHNSNVKSWSLNEPRDENQIIISSRRTDPAAGTHYVKYHSTIDDIEIIHTAHSRAGFTSGAIAAAVFVQDKKGLFTMKDVLGF